MIVAISMGRKDSKGFPGKNLHRVMGRFLASYPLQAARHCPEIDKAYLSTDDEQLMEFARENDIEVIVRPPQLCTEEALGEDVYVHAYNYAKNKNKMQDIELVVLLMCNAATITPEIISTGIKVLRENPDYDSCVTVSRYNMWSPLRARKIGDDGLLRSFVPFEAFGDPKRLNCDRDSQGDVWFADMGASIVRPRCLENIGDGLLPQRWMGQKIYPLKQYGGCDIDFRWQIPQVEYWLREHGFSEYATPYEDRNIIRAKPHIERLHRPLREQPERIGKMRLDKNENIAGWDKNILKKVLSGINSDFISSYPEIGKLYKKLSNYLGCRQENLVITFGSDGAIKSVFEAFVTPGDKVITLDPTYAMYDVYCDMFGAIKVPIEFDKKLKLPVQKLKDCISDNIRLVAIANPNSPTATVISRKDLLEIFEIAFKNRVLVLLDEAYFGFYKQTMLPYIGKYSNLIITRTFSKTAGLASLRIGYAVGDASVIEPLYRIKPMYESTGLAVRFAEYILENSSIVDEYIIAVQEGKAYLTQSLRELGLEVFPSYTNFLVVEVPKLNNKLAESLSARGILIKGGYPHPTMRDTIRITVGPRNQMTKFMKIFKSCFKELAR